MFILINIYFVGHVYTLFGVGEEAYLRQVVKGVSLFRGVLLLGGYVYLFLIRCPGGTSIKEGMFIWHYRVCDMGENSKIHFFQVFHFKLYFHFHNHKSS